MAKSNWISDEERERIVRMRKAGVPVALISKQTERSTNYIYRLLRKVNGHVPTKRTSTVATVSDPATSVAPAPASSRAGEERSHLLEGLAGSSSAALLCAVESMEVSAYEPLPMPRSVSATEQRQPQAPVSDTESASVIFGAAPVAASAKPHEGAANDEFWLLPEATPSTARLVSTTNIQVAADTAVRSQVQPSKKQKTSTAQDPSQKTTAPTSSSLVVNFQLPRSQMPGSTAVSNPRAASDGLNGLLNRIQAEIRRLEGLDQADLYDAQLLQMLVKFHAEMLLVQIQKTHLSAAPSKRAREEDSDDKQTSRLLREKLEKEIVLLNIQVDRERLELDRDQIRHKATAMMCRKQLLGANSSPTDVDKLFPRK